MAKCKENDPRPFKKDSDLYSKIQKVQIQCLNRTRGCTWKGTVSKLKNHLAVPECIALKGSANNYGGTALNNMVTHLNFKLGP